MQIASMAICIYDITVDAMQNNISYISMDAMQITYMAIAPAALTLVDAIVQMADQQPWMLLP